MFRQLVLARIIEPTSKQDSLRVLEETGIEPASYATVKRRLPVYGTDAWRRSLSRRAAVASLSAPVRDGQPSGHRRRSCGTTTGRVMTTV